MKSALLVSSLLVGAQAFAPSMPMQRTHFMQRQVVRAEPVKAARGRGGESRKGRQTGWGGRQDTGERGMVWDPG